MAMYKDLRGYRETDAAHADFIARKLLALRQELASQITQGRRSNSLIIGSWNIREFDSGKGGARLRETYHYLAEIIDRFDICAVQEIRNDLRPLQRLVTLLGPNWDYFVTDITVGRQGNDERIAFLYNKAKVFFRNLVGEIVQPEGKPQFARTPFFAAFQAHWFRFILCSAHIYFGDERGEKKAKRVAEIAAIAEILEERAKRENEVYILLGDLNIVGPRDPTMTALTSRAFTVPEFGPTNLGGTKHYDQIAFTGEGQKVKLLRSGKIDYRSILFLDSEKDHYAALANRDPADPSRDRWTWDSYWKTWVTHQMSDHLPVWVELEVDYSDEYLSQFVKP
ncbi:endonuclease/exonuclease/phosphatase family protein [Pannonibacter sp.]|uniref:endonuclease/exonuclease/phosphatase family protein n=1 Tax=Pannonibacter sp. TaxID=1906786 RepID=UPI003F71E177